MGVNLYVDLETLQLIQGPGQRNAFASLRFKRGDSALLRVVFLENGITPVTIGNPSELEIQIGIKPRNQFDHAYLAQSLVWTMPVAGDETPTYECTLSLNTLQLNTALNVGSATADELPEITLMGEITFREGTGEPTSTRTFIVVIENDVNRGTEGIPIEATPAYPAPANIEILANKGIANGYAPLNADGKVPATHITLTTGAAGPNSVTTATSTNLTGFISGNGTTVSGATLSAVEATPNTLALRDAGGGGVKFKGGCVFTDARIDSQNVTIISTGGTSEFGSGSVALRVQANSGQFGKAVSIHNASGTGAEISGGGSDSPAVRISSGTGIGLSILTLGAGAGTAADIRTSGFAKAAFIYNSSSGTGAEILSHAGNHLIIGGVNGKVTVANNGNTTFTGNVTAPNLVTNNGANSFAVRPSSPGPVLSSTSLITQADGDVRYGQRNFSGIAINAVSSSDTTPIKVASVLLPIGLYYIDSLVSSIHGGGLCTIGLQSNQALGINVIESYGNDNTAHITNPIGADGFSSSNRSAVTGTTFNRRVTGIVQITTHNTELSIQFSQFVANATPSTTRKRAYITATKLS